MWLKRTIILCCAIVSVLADEDIITNARPGQEYVDIRSSIGEPTGFHPRAIPVEEFVTAHKIPDGLVKPSDFEDGESEEQPETRKTVPQSDKHLDAKAGRLGSVDQSLEPAGSDDLEKNKSKRQARVELENFSDTGVLKEEGIRKLDTLRTKHGDDDDDDYKDSVIPEVHISEEYATTMRPVLTTEREYRSFDFVPVNIIREDSKNGWTPYSNRNLDDLSDVGLVPAGSNSRIQVKKGPNGKDYEYEYVYYYYDEEEEGKASASTNSQQESANRPTSPPRRSGGSGNRSKYSTVDRSTTAEPATNEVIPDKNGIRSRQLGEHEDVSEERLPTNTRFPPRTLSRSNHNTGTTEPSRGRGNRPRPNLDLVDSSSFRTHQEGPEFPQNLPKGPVRFLGVTPNENGDDKPVSRLRGRPQRVQEPAPVVEATEEIVPAQRRRPASEPIVQVESNRGQPLRPMPIDDDDDEDTESSSMPTLKDAPEDRRQADLSSEGTTVETPTTEYPSAMNKVALDLYAFIQQGHSNLVDTLNDAADDSGESTTVEEGDTTTDIPTTTEEVSPTTTEAPTTAATTTTTTEEPTTAVQVPAGRGKFRRPGIAGANVPRNRFKSSGGQSSTTTTETPAETTPRNRNRFGGAGTGGYKRARPSNKQRPEDEIQKDSSSSVTAEKPSGRNRYRGSAPRSSLSTTSATPTSSSASSSGISRPAFNKLSAVNRRRGRPSTTAAPTTDGQESQESEESSQSGPNEATHGPSTTPKSAVRARLSPIGSRPVRPVVSRVNLRSRPGQGTTTSAAPAPEVSDEGSVEEPAGEGTEEETQEAPTEKAPAAVRQNPINPLNKLRSRNRLQIQPKTTTRAPVAVSPHRRSPLLPRRKTITEAPVTESSEEEEPSSEEITVESEATEATLPQSSTAAASTKHEETRGLSGLLASRRRLTPRRPGQLPVARE